MRPSFTVTLLYIQCCTTFFGWGSSRLRLMYHLCGLNGSCLFVYWVFFCILTWATDESAWWRYGFAYLFLFTPCIYFLIYILIALWWGSFPLLKLVVLSGWTTKGPKSQHQLKANWLHGVVFSRTCPHRGTFWTSPVCTILLLPLLCLLFLSCEITVKYLCKCFHATLERDYEMTADGLSLKVITSYFYPLFHKATTMKCQTLGVSCILNMNFDSWGCWFDWWIEIMPRPATCLLKRTVIWCEVNGCKLCSDGSDGILEVVNNLLVISIVFTKVERMKTNQGLALMFIDFLLYEIFQHWCGFSDAPWKLVWSSRSLVIYNRGHWQLPG